MLSHPMADTDMEADTQESTRPPEMVSEATTIHATKLRSIAKTFSWFLEDVKRRPSNVVHFMAVNGDPYLA